MVCTVLVLGGTSEGRRLAEALHRDARFDVLLSFAGRTASLAPPAVPYRVGGFGGSAGLLAFLREGRFDALIDATHAFAARISANAVHAAADSATPLLRLVQPAWRRAAGDDWREVSSMDEAARALGLERRRVLLTVGRLELAPFAAAPQHDYLIRAVDPFTPPAGLEGARLLCARGPFSVADELSLLEREAIELIVSKNAGTPSTAAKLEAARALRIPVVMVERPRLPPALEVESRAAALSWLAALHAGKERGV